MLRVEPLDRGSRRGASSRPGDEPVGTASPRPPPPGRGRWREGRRRRQRRPSVAPRRARGGEEVPPAPAADPAGATVGGSASRRGRNRALGPRSPRRLEGEEGRRRAVARPGGRRRERCGRDRDRGRRSGFPHLKMAQWADLDIVLAQEPEEQSFLFEIEEKASWSDNEMQTVGPIESGRDGDYAAFERLKADLQVVQARCEELEHSNAEIVQELKQARRDVAEGRVREKALAREVDKARREIAQGRVQKKALDQEVDKARAREDEARKKVCRLVAEARGWAANEASLRKDLAQARGEVAEGVRIREEVLKAWVSRASTREETMLRCFNALAHGEHRMEGCIREGNAILDDTPLSIPWRRGGKPGRKPGGPKVPRTCKRCSKYKGKNKQKCRGRTKHGQNACEYFEADGTVVRLI